MSFCSKEEQDEDMMLYLEPKPSGQIDFVIVQGFWGDIDMDFEPGAGHLRFLALDLDDENPIVNVEIHYVDKKKKSEMLCFEIELISQVLYSDPSSTYKMPTTMVIRLTAQAITRIQERMPEKFEQWSRILNSDQTTFKSFSDCWTFVLDPERVEVTQHEIDPQVKPIYRSIKFFKTLMRFYWMMYMEKYHDCTFDDSENIIEELSDRELIRFAEQFKLYYIQSDLLLDSHKKVLIFTKDKEKADQYQKSAIKNDPAPIKKVLVEPDSPENSDDDESGSEETMRNREEEELELIENEHKRQNGELTDDESDNDNNNRDLMKKPKAKSKSKVDVRGCNADKGNVAPPNLKKKTRKRKAVSKPTSSRGKAKRALFH